MANISTINGIAENNIASWNGTAASNIASLNSNTWVSVSGLSFASSQVITSSSTPFTFSDVDLGNTTAHKVVVGITHSATAAATGITVDGNACALVKNQAASGIFCELWEVNGITSATGNIVVTLGAASSRCSCGGWQVDGAADEYAEADSASTPAAITGLTLPTGGVQIGIARSNLNVSWTWSGLGTEDFDAQVDDAFTGASSLSANSLTDISATPSSSNLEVMAVASWAPA